MAQSHPSRDIRPLQMTVDTVGFSETGELKTSVATLGLPRDRPARQPRPPRKREFSPVAYYEGSRTARWDLLMARASSRPMPRLPNSRVIFVL